MKSIILSAILSFLAVAASAQIAPTPPYKDGASGLLANETGLAYNKQYVIDMAQYAGSRVSAQVLYTSSVFAASTFSDGSQSTGALTIVNYKSLAYTTSYFSIGGVNFYEGASGGWTAATSNAATATSIQNVLNTYLGSVLLSSNTSSSAIVYSTSVFEGTAYNFAWTLSPVNTAYWKTNSPALTGGINPAFSLGGTTINIPAHGWTQALPVLYTANSAAIYYSTPSVAPVQYELTDQTTYYVGAVNTNYVSLALTSAQAVAGTYMTFTSTPTQVGAHAPQLKPETLTVAAAFGTASLLWQSSNDNANWITAQSNWSNVATVLVTTATALSDTGTDFGFYDYRYLRLNVTAPSTGWLWLQAPVRIKQDGIGPF